MTRFPTESKVELNRENDPVIVEQRLIETIGDWEFYSKGQMADWIWRMKSLDKPARHRLWVALARKLPKSVFEYIRKWYRDSLSPDRRGR